MKIVKRLLSVSLMVLMVLSIFTMNLMAAPKATVEVKRGSAVIDAKIDEIWSHVEEMKIDRNLTVIAGTPGASGYAKMLWDDEYLYCLVVINDSTKHNENKYALSREDCLEVFFNLNNNKTYENYTGSTNCFRFLYDITTDFATAVRNPENTSAGAGNTAAMAAFFEMAGDESSPTQNIYEFKMDAKIGIDFSLKPGIEIGIDFSYDDSVDGADAAAPRVSWNSEGNDNSAANPSLVGTVKLVDEDAMPVIEEIVEAPEATAEAAPTITAPVTTPTAPKTNDAIFIFALVLLTSALAVVTMSKTRRIKK